MGRSHGHLPSAVSLGCVDTQKILCPLKGSKRTRSTRQRASLFLFESYFLFSRKKKVGKEKSEEEKGKGEMSHTKCSQTPTAFCDGSLLVRDGSVTTNAELIEGAGNRQDSFL